MRAHNELATSLAFQRRYPSGRKQDDNEKEEGKDHICTSTTQGSALAPEARLGMVVQGCELTKTLFSDERIITASAPSSNKPIGEDC